MKLITSNNTCFGPCDYAYTEQEQQNASLMVDTTQHRYSRHHIIHYSLPPLSATREWFPCLRTGA